MTVDELLKTARAESALTQEQLAYKSGLSVNTIRQIEQGNHTDPRLSTLKALAKGLDKPVSFFTSDYHNSDKTFVEKEAAA